MLTEEQRAQIKARAEEATQGEWLMGDTDLDYGAVLRTDGTLVANAYTERDAAFIVHARADIPALLAENAHLRAILAHAYFDIIKHGEQGACFCGVCILTREVMTQEEADHLLFPLEPL